MSASTCGQRAGVGDHLAQRRRRPRRPAPGRRGGGAAAPPAPASARSTAVGDQDRPLALAQVVAGGLAGLRPGRRTRPGRRRAAGTPRPAAARSAVYDAMRRRRRAPARAPPRCSGRSIGVLRRLVANHPHRPLHRATAARLLEQVEVLPGHQLGAHHVVDRLGPHQRRRRAGRRTCSSSSAHDRHRSPSRIAAPTPKASCEPSHVAAAVERREPPVRRSAGRGGCPSRP